METPPRPRYPTTLSRSSARTPRTPLQPRPGSSKQYETLEDLLTAAGYKETRIFTPEAARIQQGTGQSPPTPEVAIDATTSETGFGRKLANFLSGWMPAASVSVGRARGAEIARRRNSPQREPTDDSSDQDDSGGRSGTPNLNRSPSHPTSKRRVQYNQGSQRTRPRLPRDFITSSPSLTRRPSIPDTSSPDVFQSNALPSSKRTLKLPPHLRGVASSPNLKRSSSAPQSTGSNQNRGLLQTSPDIISGDKENIETRGRRDRKGRSQYPSHHLLGPPNVHTRSSASVPRRPPHSTRNTSSSVSTQPLAPVLKTEDVVCRSTPGSRSNSRSRNSSHRASYRGSVADETIPPVPPLLSAALIESELNAWIQAGGKGPMRTGAERQSFFPVNERRWSEVVMDEDVDDGNEITPGLNHIVTAHLLSSASASAGTASISRSSSTSTRNHNQHTLKAPFAPQSFPHKQTTPSSSFKPDNINNPIHNLAVSDHSPMRRERSIQSLRTHLTNHSHLQYSHSRLKTGAPGAPSARVAAFNQPAPTPSQLALAEAVSNNVRRERQQNQNSRRSSTLVRANTSYISRRSGAGANAASGSSASESATGGWLDGPEWDGAMHRPNSAQPKPKRGLIPWFGGERQFLGLDQAPPSDDE